MHHLTDRIAHTTAFVTPVLEHWLEQDLAQWFNPMKDRSDDPLHHERTLYSDRFRAKCRVRVMVQLGLEQLDRIQVTFFIEISF